MLEGDLVIELVAQFLAMVEERADRHMVAYLSSVSLALFFEGWKGFFFYSDERGPREDQVVSLLVLLGNRIRPDAYSMYVFYRRYGVFVEWQVNGVIHCQYPLYRSVSRYSKF